MSGPGSFTFYQTANVSSLQRSLMLRQAAEDAEVIKYESGHGRRQSREADGSAWCCAAGSYTTGPSFLARVLHPAHRANMWHLKVLYGEAAFLLFFPLWAISLSTLNLDTDSSLPSQGLAV